MFSWRLLVLLVCASAKAKLRHLSKMRIVASTIPTNFIQLYIDGPTIPDNCIDD